MSQAGTQPVRILLVDDHVSFRQALAFVFEQKPGFVVSGQATTLAEARRLSGVADAAVVDLALPDGNGEELIAELRDARPEMTILVLSATLDRRNLVAAIEAGASGVLDKLAGVYEICAAIPRLRDGEMILSDNEVLGILEEAGEQTTDQNPLTPSEKTLLQALAAGQGDAGIAARLDAPVEEVRSQMAEVLGKLGARSRLHALLIAARRGMISFR